jgi:hypothetical protein
MDGEEGFDLELGQPAGSEPAPGGEGEPGGEPAPLPDLVEFRGPDWSAEVERAEHDAYAAKIGMDPDDLRRAIQIGRDGNRLYEKINDEWDRIREERAALSRRGGAPDGGAPGGPPPAARPSGPPTAAAPYRPTGERPAPNDVVGTMNWLAERVAAQEALLSQIPEMRDLLTQTGRLITEREFASDVAEERAVAHDAYDTVADHWKKQGYTLPPRRELERVLQRIPLSDDSDLTWVDIWDNLGWMVAGPALVKAARRRAVLDSQRPDARIRVPAASGPAAGHPGVPTGPNGSAEDQIAAMESRIGGLTVGETLLPRE